MSTRLTVAECTFAALRDDQRVPAFVLEKAKEIWDVYRDEESEEKLCYAETQGCIDADLAKSLKIWIGSHDRIIHSIYVGGASAWIKAKSEYLFFEGIDQSLLPAMGERDPFTWWIVSDTEYERFPLIIRVSIVAIHQMLSPFPDLQ